MFYTKKTLNGKIAAGELEEGERQAGGSRICTESDTSGPTRAC